MYNISRFFKKSFGSQIGLFSCTIIFNSDCYEMLNKTIYTSKKNILAQYGGRLFTLVKTGLQQSFRLLRSTEVGKGGLSSPAQPWSGLHIGLRLGRGLIQQIWIHIDIS